VITRLSTLLLATTLVTLSSGCDAKEADKAKPAADKAKPAADKAKPAADKNEKSVDEGPDKAGPPPVKPETKPDDAAKPPEGPPPGVKVKGNVITKTTSELAAEDTARKACVTKCVDARKVEALGAAEIEASCNGQCQKEHPIVQVEVVPDGPIGKP